MSYQITSEDYISPPEQALVRQAIKALPERYQVLIELALATGARESELLNIEPADLDDSEQAVQIKGLKGSLDRLIPIEPALYTRLKALAKSGKPFNVSAQRVRFVWGKIRPVKKRFHCFRHTFAIDLYKRCRDVMLVKTALGHKSINNTMVYMQFVIATGDLRKALLCSNM